uniref:Uncharacterized protein n=1 Tax=Triticum urartu TaxID=4572 RepID=A0A8R7UMI1_TRIUA
MMPETSFSYKNLVYGRKQRAVMNKVQQANWYALKFIPFFLRFPGCGCIPY